MSRNNKPLKYERSRMVIDEKPNKINTILNPYHKIRRTAENILNKE